jgi:hypothetical protein
VVETSVPAPRRRGPIVVHAIVLAVMIAVSAGVVAFTVVKQGATVYSGRAVVANADSVLATTEQSVDRLVAERHGVEAADTRCYFSRHTPPPPRQHHNDVGTDDVWCGPVLFIADDPAADYLHFALHQLGRMLTGQVALDTETVPRSATPSSPPTGRGALLRPDGKSIKVGERLRPPPTPSADPNIFIQTALVKSLPPVETATGGQIGSISGGVSVSTLGTTPAYGAGDATRQAAKGQKFIVFQTGGAVANDNGSQKDLSANATVVVDNGLARPLPTGSPDGYYLISVPTDAQSVDLVLNDSGFNQSLSLLTGKPASTNIAILGRRYRVPTSKFTTYPDTFTYSPSVGFADNTDGTSETGVASVSYLGLQYQETLGTQTVHASSNTAALLVMDIDTTKSHTPAGPFELQPGFITFTPAGGIPLPAKALTDGTHLLSYLEVPANITAGTLTLGGSVQELYSDFLGVYQVSLATVSIPVEFAAVS